MTLNHNAWPYVPDLSNGYTPLIFQHLSLDNDGTTRDMNVDGSVTPQNFEFGVAAGQIAVLESFGFELQDAKGFGLNEFGNLGAALTNGLLIQMVESDGTLLADFTQGEPITTNAEMYQYSMRVGLEEWGAGDDMLHGRITFDAVTGSSLVVSNGYKFRVVVQDNLTGLTKFHMYVGGYYGVGINGRSGRK